VRFVGLAPRAMRFPTLRRGPANHVMLGEEPFSSVCCLYADGQRKTRAQTFNSLAPTNRQMAEPRSTNSFAFLAPSSHPPIRARYAKYEPFDCLATF
jgi:hypothetical protein